MIKDTINRLNSELPATVRLVAVSKFHPFEAIEEAYVAGQRVFAESRPQELLSKVKRLDEIRAERGESDYMSDIEWHFIGHLQTNKLKMVLPYVSLVQSVDSVRLLDAIQAWAAANSRVVSVLLEPHVAAEETKQGFSAEEIYDILARTASGYQESPEVQSGDSSHRPVGQYPNICFRGIMGMATFTDDQTVVASDFAALRSIFDTCRSRFPHLAADFTELSIGMSDDYPLAIEYGSTMIRIGSMIFGERKY
jgi:pyridoxal phosphate enzyme (YggS family)